MKNDLMVSYELMMTIRDKLPGIVSECISDVSLDIIIDTVQKSGWYKIEDDGPPEEGRWYDVYTWTREGHRTVRELFFDGENEYGIHWLGDGDWPYPVSHWKERTDPPVEE